MRSNDVEATFQERREVGVTIRTIQFSRICAEQH
jgi:hypothetical protein